MGWICYCNLQLLSQPHQSVTFSQIAFWNIKVSTEFWAYLVQPFPLNCKKSGLWIFPMGTAFLIQSLSELLTNQPNGKYWKSLLQFRKKAQKCILKVNSMCSSTITTFILFCGIPAMLKQSWECGCLSPRFASEVVWWDHGGVFSFLQATAYFLFPWYSFFPGFTSSSHAFGVEGEGISPYHFPRLGWRGHLVVEWKPTLKRGN